MLSARRLSLSLGPDDDDDDDDADVFVFVMIELSRVTGGEGSNAAIGYDT